MSDVIPFIEVRIVKSQIDSKENSDFILGEIINWYKRKVCRVKILRDEEKPYVRIEYHQKDEKKFWDNVFLYTLWDKIQKKKIDLPLKNSKISLTSMNNQKKLFLILKYTTNKKKKLRLDFNFSVNMMNSFGFEITFQEVLDGFLLFYKTLDDFLISQVKNRSFQELLKIIKKKKFLTLTNLNFLKKNYKYLKSKE